MAKPKLLVIEDESFDVSSVRAALGEEFDIETTAAKDDALDAIAMQAPAVVLLGPRADGRSADAALRLIGAASQAGPGLRIIACTAGDDQGLAAQAIAQGAYDVLSQPLDLRLLSAVVRRAARAAGLEREARQEGRATNTVVAPGLLGTSPAFQRILEAVRKVATTDVPLLITGENGTGKELIARAIHDRGARRNAPFVIMHCGAIPERVLDSELFGEEGEARSGSSEIKPGKLESAHGGTLLLQEVSELPPALQAKLLRFLQERTCIRSGGHRPVDCDVRIIASNCIGVKDAVEKGLFREDLYYRLGTVHINLPRLRERGDDVVVLSMRFLRQAAAQTAVPMPGFSREAVAALRAYNWPGNVRELSDRVARAFIMSDGTPITPADLDIPYHPDGQGEESISFKVNQQRVETDLIMKAFTLSHGNLSRAAHELGISRSTLYRRLRQYGMDRALDVRRALNVSQ